MFVVALSGSPRYPSNSGLLIDFATEFLGQFDIKLKTYRLTDFNTDALIRADFSDEIIQNFQEDIRQSDGLVVATPIYKASFSGVLKLMLDILPQEALNNKIVLPFGSAGSIVHLLALDYALKPVLASMKAREILEGVFIEDQHIHSQDAPSLDKTAIKRLDRALTQFLQALLCKNEYALSKDTLNLLKKGHSHGS